MIRKITAWLLVCLLAAGAICHAEETAAADTARYTAITIKSVQPREGMGKGRKYRKIRTDAKVEVLEYGERWCLVHYKDRTGYVRTKDLWGFVSLDPLHWPSPQFTPCKGYVTLAAETNIKGGKFSIEDYEKAISSLVGSTVGQESEAAFDKLFDDMNLQDKDLGKEVSQRTKLISKVINKVYDIDFNFEDAEFDVLGTAYMILIGLFASDAGKKGGEFFTPTKMSQLVARLATLGLGTVKSACDPCAGSGSLLLEVKRHCSNRTVNHYYGQEKNGTTYNLMRQNMLMHGVPYKEFTVYNDDTIEHDNFGELRFQVQVANPPYSAKWSADPRFESDPRFSNCGALAPKSYADLMFLEHIAYHMDNEVSPFSSSQGLFPLMAVSVRESVLQRGSIFPSPRLWYFPKPSFQHQLSSLSSNSHSLVVIL